MRGRWLWVCGLGLSCFFYLEQSSAEHPWTSILLGLFLVYLGLLEHASWRERGGGPGRQGMASEDAYWLQDSEEHERVNQPIILSLWDLDRTTLADVRRAWGERVLRLVQDDNDQMRHRLERLTQKVVRGSLEWARDRDFAVERHVVAPGQPVEFGSALAFQEYVARLAEEALPTDRPLWQMQVVDTAYDGGTKVLMRVHHAYSDGIALTRIIFDNMDEPTAEERAAASSLLSAISSRRTPGQEPSGMERALKALWRAPEVLFGNGSAKVDDNVIHSARRQLSGVKRVAWSER